MACGQPELDALSVQGKRRPCPSRRAGQGGCRPVPGQAGVLGVPDTALAAQVPGSFPCSRTLTLPAASSSSCTSIALSFSSSRRYLQYSVHP